MRKRCWWMGVFGVLAVLAVPVQHAAFAAEAVTDEVLATTRGGIYINNGYCDPLIRAQCTVCDFPK